jgi:hypothetical protein
MTPHDVDILLVEDHAPDAELTLHALRLHTVESRVYVVHDGGPKRSTSSFCRGPFAGRSFASRPRSCCSISSSPRSTAWKCSDR